MKSSSACEVNVKKLKVEGEVTASMLKFERRRRGVEWRMSGETVEWRRVGKRRVEGQRREGSCWRDLRRPGRGCRVVVTMSLVIVS